MGLFGNHARVGASAAGDYEIERSLRFNPADDTYLHRTPSGAGNRKTWTWSGWVKRGSTFTRGVFFSCGTSLGSNEDGIEFDGLVIRVYSYTGSFGFQFTTNAQYRDPSAWMHIVFSLDTTQASSGERGRLYVNGERVTSLATETQPSLNADCAHINTTSEHKIGNQLGSHEYDGYLADVNFIDGTRLDASSFGETNIETGQWIPKKYGGSYGTNGFHLNFSDNSGTTATTLGKDSAGSNNWTPSGFSVAAGVGNDSMTDTPTNNFCTWNPLTDVSDLVLANGNLNVSSGTDSWPTVYGTMGASSGKFYFEATNTDQTRWGLGWSSTAFKAGVSDSFNDGYFAYSQDPLTRYETGTNSSINGSPAFDTSKTLQVAIDITAGKIWYGINNTWVNNDSGSAGDPANGSNPISTFTGGTTMFPKVINNLGNVSVNWGQQGFTYTPPTGFETLSTSNLADPTIKLPNEHFGTLVYAGDGSASRTISDTSSVNFTPDWVWVKNRSQADWHILSDVVRGFDGKTLYSNTAGAEHDASGSGENGYISAAANGGFTATDSDGSVGGNLNANSENYVAWNWKGGGAGSANTTGDIDSTVSANASAGFSIVKYTGNGTLGQSVGHGLGIAPKIVIFKNRSRSSRNWEINYVHPTDGSLDYIYLNLDVGKGGGSLGISNPTSSVFYVTNGNDSNQSGDDIIAYCFANVEGYSKFSSYEGIGGTDGPFVHTGFRPVYVLIKNVDSDSRWWVIKTTKIPGYNPHAPALFTNNANAETNESSIDILSNGFKVRNNGSYTNENGSTHIYLAFAEFPFKYANAR